MWLPFCCVLYDLLLGKEPIVEGMAVPLDREIREARRHENGLRGEQVELVVSRSSDPYEMQAYEELLGDALEGNSSRFARQDYVEEAWRIFDPVLDDATPIYPYAPGSWEPGEADALALPDG